MKSALREIAGCGASPAPRVTPKRKTLSREEYVAGILRGDRTVLARAVTLHLAGKREDVVEKLMDLLKAKGGLN